MKKLIYACSVLALLFSSCSGDSDSPATDGTLLKKIIGTDSDGEVFTINYTYSGNKIVKAAYSDGSHDDYTYTGDLITKIEIYSDLTTLSDTEIYEYNSDNKLVNYIMKSNIGDEPRFASRTAYVYNADGTISFTDYTGTHDSQTEFAADGKIYANKYEENVVLGGPTPDHIDAHTCTFDGKNNPLKNVTGMGRIHFSAGNREGFDYTQNVVSDVHTNTNGAGLTQPMYDSTFTYNSNNYPVTEEETYHVYGGGDEITTYQFFYE